MLATYFLPENVAQQDGSSTEIALGAARCTPLLLTLGITRIIEQESMDFSVWGSPDKENWEFLLAFPQKSYCGTYSMHLDLARFPGIRYLRAHWKMSRWAPSEDSTPLFGFYLLAEEAKLQAMGA
jgi:hypothetical protein